MIFLPETVKQFILSYEKFLIIGHLEPDGDCISSQLVLAGFLRRIGKKAELFSAGPFDRPEIFSYRESFQDRISPCALSENPSVIIVDCSTVERTGDLCRQTRGLPLLVIDHHTSGKEFGDIRWVVPSAPSTSYLIQHMIERLGYTLTAEEANLILFGLASDTGYFRHLTEGSSQVFESVSRLVNAGACPKEVYSLIYGGREMTKVRLLARSLLRVEEFFNGRVLITCQKLEDYAEAGESLFRGSDDLYRLLQTVKGCEVIAFIREESEDRISVGLRSSNEMDVGAIALSLGGGGHKRAAGFTSRGSAGHIKQQLLSIFKELL